MIGIERNEQETMKVLWRGRLRGYPRAYEQAAISCCRQWLRRREDGGWVAAGDQQTSTLIAML